MVCFIRCLFWEVPRAAVMRSSMDGQCGRGINESIVVAAVTVVIVVNAVVVVTVVIEVTVFSSVPPDEPGYGEEQVKNELVTTLLSGCMSFCMSLSAKRTPVMARIMSAESVAFLGTPGMLGAAANRYVSRRNKGVRCWWQEVQCCVAVQNVCSAACGFVSFARGKHRKLRPAPKERPESAPQGGRPGWDEEEAARGLAWPRGPGEKKFFVE